MAEHDVCIIDYGMGNLMSVLRAFELIGCSVVVSNHKEDIMNAKRLILPGVGAFSVAMDNLRALNLIDLLHEEVLAEGKPFLGICLGMQLIAEDSYEHGHFKGLGWVPASVRRLELEEGMRVPHMGWNDVYPVIREKSLFDNIEGESSYYFVHSYHVDCREVNYVGSTCKYGVEFVSTIQHKNIYAAQFHPEKSQNNGIQMLRNFINHTAAAINYL
ncbi:imidazole glycerol phosphate synthase subunit HisH [Paenibacillus agricola]|uniref:Imidazole glycerol phosphate synthase subunit HisH n=1 Tax=Paenibacillus agricola TaxID=2716264 RepID=A0ABX0JD46_9BACL|nr:imidazole glycerol phosphate synthase subunit HisH [Paenibacillus agricola]NHN33878.1 imidazole glycerol phosphate synthase subunit HisH [Paenibacillus agricola]